MVKFESLQTNLQCQLANRPRNRTVATAAAELSYGRHHGPPPFDARDAAVMVLLYPRDGQWHLPLTVRPNHLPDHPGQVCLPGGAREPGETLEQCAMRELAEELGVEGTDITVVGRLSQIYVFASNFRVVPFVAVTRNRPEFQPQASEVAEVLEPPVNHLTDIQQQGSHKIRRGGLEFSADHIDFERHRIWGATRIILAEFLDVAAEC